MIRLGDGWLYARKSAYRGRLKDRGRSVDEQLTEGGDWCHDNEVHVAGKWIDDDRSASPMAEEVPREEFDEMTAAIESGVVKRGDVVVTWEASRLYRDLAVYVELRKACAKAGVYLCINGELFDLTKRSDRRRSALDAVDAEDRAWEISEQVQRSLRANARQGRPHGRHQYGYTRIYDSRTGDLVKVIANEAEATVVKELFDRAFSHESEWSIMADFNARRIWSPSGKARHRDIGSALAQLRGEASLTVTDVATTMRWKDQRVERIEEARWGIRLDEMHMLCELYNAPETVTAGLENLWRTLPQWTNYAQVRQILTNKAYIGLRQYNNREEESKAIWPAIVKPEVFHAVNLMLNDPARRTTRTTEQSHLLTALIECGKTGCGGESRPQWREPRSVVLLVPHRKDKSPPGVRDAALLVVLEASGGRCAFVAAARVEDFDADAGVLRVVGDRGEHQVVELTDWAVRCVGRWLDVLDRTSGPLFCHVDESAVKDDPLTADSVRTVVNTRRQHAGFRPLAPDEFPTAFDGDDLPWLTYACGRHHCFRARAEDVERYVVAQLVLRFARHDAPEIFAMRSTNDEVKAHEADIVQWETDLAEAEDLVAKHQMTSARLANLEAKIEPKIKTAEREINKARVDPLLSRLIRPDAEAVYAEWQRLTLRQQRAVIRSELRIVITPKGKGRRNMPAEEYVHLSWRRDHTA